MTERQGNADSSWNTIPNAGCVPDTGSAIDGDAAFEVADQTADDVEERRLAAAGRPDDRHELALCDGERNAVDRQQRVFSGTKALDDVGDRQDRRRGGGARRGRLLRQGNADRHYWRGGICTSSASCSFVSGADVNLSATASCTIESRPTTLSGSIACFGKKSSRVRFAFASEMPTKSA